MTAIMLDTIVGILIMLSVVIAFFRGFVREALTVVNLLGAAGAAWFAGPHLIPGFSDWLGVVDGNGGEVKNIWGVVPPEVMANFLAYATVFFGAFLILTLAGMSIAGTIKALGLGPIDRILGMVFGAARGFLLVFLIYLPFGSLMDPQKYPEWAKDSVSVSVLDETYVKLDEYLAEAKEDEKDGKKDGPVDPDSMEGKLQKMKSGLKKNNDAPAQQEKPFVTPASNLTEEEEEILQ